MPADDPMFLGLLDQFVTEMSDRYALASESWAGWAAPPPGTVHLLLVEGDTTGTRVALGCAAIMPFTHSEPGTVHDLGQLKRLFVVPTARGRGLATTLHTAVLDTARATGYRRLYLETGDKQPEAIALYHRLGWHPVPRYGPWVDNSESLCFTLELADPRLSSPASPANVRYSRREPAAAADYLRSVGLAGPVWGL